MAKAIERVQPARVAKHAPATGLLTVVAAVTGTEDHVKDVIQPSAFVRTLRLRRPKAVMHHDWTKLGGRITRIVELMPGDPRLPKETKDGRPWPKDAGALIATIQCNMRTQAGRDFYEWARFYTESGECEWSIGYKATRAVRRKDGVRVILDLDLYEVSLVLHGAHGDTMTLEVKSGQPSELEVKGAPLVDLLRPAALAVLEAKALNAAPTPDGPKYAGLAVVAEDTGRVLMLQRALSLNDPAAGLWEFPGGGLEPGETAAGGALREWREETGLHLPEGELVGTWDRGPYRGHAYAIKRETDVQLNPDHDDRAVLNPDDPTGAVPEVTAWFSIEHLDQMPALRPEVRSTDWSVLGRAAGGLAERALEAKGLYGGSAGCVDVPALGPHQRTKPRPSRSRGLAAAAVKSARALPLPRMETKTMHQMEGSYEQRAEVLRAAVCDLLGRDTEGACHVCVEATYDDHVIASLVAEDGTRTYEVPYSWVDGEVSLGEASDAEVIVTARRVEGGPEVVADEAEVALARFYAPAAAKLAEVTGLVAAAVEGKALDEHLRVPLLRLLDELAVKGVDPYADAPLDDDEEPEGPVDPLAEMLGAKGSVLDDEVDPPLDDDEDEPVALAPPAVPALPAEPEQAPVVLDPEQVRKDLEALAA